MAADNQLNQGGTSDIRPLRPCVVKRFEQRCRDHMAIIEASVFGQRGNYTSGWCAGEVDFY